MSNERLPCPFCGNRMDDYDLRVWEINVKEYTISCRNCGANGPSGISKDDATKMWNLRRADDADRARLVAQVEAQRREERRMFEDLTPGGSEFHDSPRTVAAYLKDRMSTVIKVAQRAKAAEAQVEQLEAKVTRLTAALMAADEALLAMDETGDDDE